MNFNSTLPAGVFTATLTPMNDDLSVNYASLINHINWLLDNGSDGICLLGTTGEANSFTLEERIEIIDQVIDSGIDPRRLLTGTGNCAYPDTVKLTKHAVNRGVGGVLMLPPFYYKDVSDDGMLDYFKLVIDQVNSANLRIYLYHFPQLTGVPYTLPLIEKLVAAHPGVIVGMKDSSGNWQGMADVLAAIPGFKLYSGSERFLLQTLRAGGAGCITATANATVKLTAAVNRHWQEDDKAEALQQQLTGAREKFEFGSFITTLKCLLAEWHGDLKWLNLRPPNALPDAETRQRISHMFREEDF
jgi:4-hydroxy-tetrahydrodipicolinate synthase